MTPVKKRVAAIWLISAWPALNFLMMNWSDVAWRPLVAFRGVLLFTLLMGGIGHWLELRGEKRGRGGVVVVTWVATIALIFGYSALALLLTLVQEKFGLHLPPLPVWAFLATLIVPLVFLSRRAPKFQGASTTFCFIVVGVTLVMLVNQITMRQPTVTEQDYIASPIAVKAARLPGLNVYYIILDAYAGNRGMNQTMGFDNSVFFQRMVERGFVDASTESSNYLRTVQTLGGIFALDYPLSDNPLSWKNLGAMYPEVFERETAPPLIRRLHSMGYTAWHSATVWGGCSHRHLECLGLELIVAPDFVTQAFLGPTPIGRPLMKLAAQENDTFLSVTSRLPALMASEKPFFIFAHNMAPHPPFVVDAQCRRRPWEDKNWNDWLAEDRDAYLGAVKCVNVQVERMVDVIIRADPNALIVLQSDHGTAFTVDWEAPMAQWSAASIRERSSYLNLIRAPQDCRQWLNRPIGQINTARFVVACLEGRAPDYLPEHTYLSTYSEGPEKGMLVHASQ
ncbi:MAG: sulfatase-like hydrolase/transferase [Pseudomonadota bacterium]